MMPAAADLLIVEGLEKSFTLHLHGGARLPVVAGVAFAVERGECVVLGGPSGAGKSSILKMAYGNYRADRGRILLADGGRFLDIAQASPGEIVDARRRIMGYVSRFLRVIPRVSALDIVAAAARGAGLEVEAARARAAALLARLNLPNHLWALPPATFFGRRAAAGQHRPRLRRRARSPDSRRTDRLARRCQSRRGGCVDRRAARAWGGVPFDLP